MRNPTARSLLFVGDGRLPAQGGDRLIAAVGRRASMGPTLSSSSSADPARSRQTPHPAWMRVERAEGTAIAALLPDVLATVIPRPRNAYNDLALPIKLFDYLAYGRPLLVTDCVEQARVVNDASAGIVTSDDVPAMADAIGRVASASADELDRWSSNAQRGRPRGVVVRARGDHRAHARARWLTGRRADGSSS